MDSNQNKDSVVLLGLDKVEDNKDITRNTNEIFPNNAVQNETNLQSKDMVLDDWEKNTKPAAPTLDLTINDNTNMAAAEPDAISLNAMDFKPTGVERVSSRDLQFLFPWRGIIESKDYTISLAESGDDSKEEETVPLPKHLSEKVTEHLDLNDSIVTTNNGKSKDGNAPATTGTGVKLAGTAAKNEHATTNQEPKPDPSLSKTGAAINYQDPENKELVQTVA